MVANENLKCYMRKKGNGYYRTCKDKRTGKQVRRTDVKKKAPIKKKLNVKKPPVKKKLKIKK
jgi:hypothetical protein